MSGPATVPHRGEAVGATLLGAWPGLDPHEAAKVSLGLLTAPHLPALAQLPGRGVGSDAVGRTAGLLLELPVDVQPYGWRFVDRPGHDQRRAVSALATDINVLADVAGAAELHPEAFKDTVMGPVSLAAAVHLHYGERAISDPGARRDVAASLAAGLVLHAAKLRAAVPGAALTLQLDEPDVARALAGTLPTVSGYRTLRAVPLAELRQCWGDVVAAARTAGFARVVLHLPDPGTVEADTRAWRTALELAVASGVDEVAVPLAALDTGHWELLAGALEAGVGLWAGVVPATATPPPYAELVARIERPWRGLGLPVAALNLLRVTPVGGLAGLSPQAARATSQRALDVAEALTALRHR